MPGPDGSVDAVGIGELHKEQRAWLVERVLETKDQDIRRLLEKIRDRKNRHATAAVNNLAWNSSIRALHEILDVN